MGKMVLGIASGNIEKLTAAGIILNGAVAQDMEVEVFLLLGGAYAFKKGNFEDFTNTADYRDNLDEFLNGMKEANVKYWLDMFKTAKEIGDVKIHLCGTAGKIWKGYKLEDFEGIVDDIGGISEYINALEECDVSLFI